MKRLLLAAFMTLIFSATLNAAVSVVTQTVVNGDISELLSFTGEVKPLQEAVVSPDVSGMVDKVLVENGQTVKARQPLILIDKARALIALRQAELQVKRAEQMIKESRSDYQRNKILREKQVLNEKAFEISESQYVNAENSLKEASAGVELARLNLDRTTITAPFAGFFVNRQVFTGQWLTNGQPLGRVIDLHQVYVEARIPETLINRLRVGQECRIDGHVPGKVAFIDLYADSSRGFLVKLLVDNPDLRFKANMYVKGEIILEKFKNVPLLPITSLLNEAGQYSVFILTGKTARKRPVEVLAREGDRCYLKGVETGETLITVGQNNLSDGMEVQAAETTVPESAPASGSSSTHSESSPTISTTLEEGR